MGRSPSPCCDKDSGLKKGPWTQQEDLKLTQYVQIHGPGNWRTLPKNAGLQRRGKSCRLRWTNYLRPDIKRGRFSFEEEETVIQLHSVLGNKWSAIASRLPGRTDNEIKNYWNTNIRKRLLKNGINPVTHRPRLDLLDLWSILNSASFSLSRFLNIANTQVLRHANDLLASPSLNQENKELFHFINQVPYMNQITSNEQIANASSIPVLPSNQLLNQEHHMDVNNCDFFLKNLVKFNSQTSQENSMPSHIIDDSVILQNYNDQFTSQASENSKFQPSTTENDIIFGMDSVFPITPVISSPTPLESLSSMFMNGGSSTEDDIESYCSKYLKFEIPEIEFGN